MKNTILLITILLAFAFGSCNKSYRCECLDTQKNALEHHDIKATKQGDAESKCAEHNSPAGSGGLANCHLK